MNGTTAIPSFQSSQQAGPVNYGTAFRFLWFVFIFFLASTTIGLAWDRRWHTTHVFDTFYAPPHLFTYGMSLVSAAMVAIIAFVPSLRNAFAGEWHEHADSETLTFQVPVLNIEMPGCLILLGGGFCTLAIAGALDDVWHTTFGLDETVWSTPHAMIGWGLLMIVLGFIACRLALRHYRPLAGFTIIILGMLLMIITITPILGPFATSKTVEQLQLTRLIPVLKAQPTIQHTYRIYITHNVTRTNPILAPLGALWAGIALGMLRRLDRRARIWLLVAGLWSLEAFLSSRREARALALFFHRQLPSSLTATLPFPIFPAALMVLVSERLRLRERTAWLIAGAIFGGCVAAFWEPGAHPGIQLLVLVVLSAGTMWLGAAIGKRVFGVVVDPVPRQVIRVGLAGIIVPLLTGVLDLYLRHVTP